MTMNIACIMRQDNGKRMPVALELCPHQGFAVAPSYFDFPGAVERFGSEWIVRRLQAGALLELRQMPNGDWFVVEWGGTEGEVINGDQLRDLRGCSTTTTTTAGPSSGMTEIAQPVPLARRDQKPDGPYQDGAAFGIQWEGTRYPCDQDERLPWEILSVMWPPIDQEERTVEEVQSALAERRAMRKQPGELGEQWGKNNAGLVRKILNRVQLGFTFKYLKTDRVQVFRWHQVCV